MVIWWTTIAAAFGLMFGSAINALVWRLYVGRSWVKGRSECPDCGHVLGAKDLVPVLSWVMLGGKCRYCRAPIKDHPVVELVTAAVFAVSTWVALTMAPVGEPGWLTVTRLGFWLVLAVLMIILAVYDLRWMLLPDKVMVPLVGVALVYSATMAVATQAPQVFVGAATAAVAAGLSFYGLVAATKGRAMGGGDIKLVFAMGLMLGLKATAVALMVAFNVAAVWGIVLMAQGRRTRKDQIPFGPFLVGGALVGLWFGQAIVAWYLNLSGLV